MTRRDMLWLAAFAIAGAAIACSRPVKRPDGGEGLLGVGAVAPDFTATTKAGERVTLSSMKGQPVVVYFYPKDETPGCTKEACAFRDAWNKFTAKHVGLVGVSRDTEASHREFVKHHELPFPLAADEDGKISRSYGVPTTLGMDARVTFLVGADGRVAKVWPKVDPGVHADEVLAAAEALH
ncbi:MAG TPA: peroxiredoxin [Polyangiaceae bacterium]|nr:peroxiredoxin [Polyangiaceae bacterium]